MTQAKNKIYVEICFKRINFGTARSSRDLHRLGAQIESNSFVLARPKCVHLALLSRILEACFVFVAHHPRSHELQVEPQGGQIRRHHR